MEAVLERPQVASYARKKELTPVPSIKDRVLKAARLYLERQGFEVKQRWESDTQLGYIAVHEDVLVFVHVVSNGLDKQGFPPDTAMKREEFEQKAIGWLSKNGHDYGGMQVRYDEIALTVLCKDKALIRHHLNAWSD